MTTREAASNGEATHRSAEGPREDVLAWLLKYTSTLQEEHSRSECEPEVDEAEVLSQLLDADT